MDKEIVVFQISSADDLSYNWEKVGDKGYLVTIMPRTGDPLLILFKSWDQVLGFISHILSVSIEIETAVRRGEL